MKKTYQRSHTWFLEKYSCISIYDIDLKTRYTIDYEDICFVNKYVCALIGNPDHPNGTSKDNKYFFIHSDLFSRILATNHNDNISLKNFPKNNPLPSTNDISIDPSTKLKKSSGIFQLAIHSIHFQFYVRIFYHIVTRVCSLSIHCLPRGHFPRNLQTLHIHFGCFSNSIGKNSTHYVRAA